MKIITKIINLETLAGLATLYLLFGIVYIFLVGFSNFLNIVDENNTVGAGTVLFILSIVIVTRYMEKKVNT